MESESSYSEQSDNQSNLSESDNQSESSYSDNQWEYSEPRPLFQEVLCCFSIKQYKNPLLEIGDKIILPPSSLSQIILIRSIKYPLIFKLQTFKADGVSSYCGVLEFDAEEGNIYLPEWMMRNLGIEDGESIIVSNAGSVLKGVYMKLQPHATAFTELANPRAVLERVLRGFTCLGRGSTIMIEHNQVDFYFDVLEVSPGDVISLIDTDCEVEFATPLDYVEPRSDGGGSIEKVDLGREEEEKKEEEEFRPFTGKGRRLDGKVAVTTAVEELSKLVIKEEKKSAVAVTAELSKSPIKDEKKSGKEEGKVEFKPFSGKSRVLGVPPF